MRGDLHLHSTASDGQYSPKELVEMALAKGLLVISITDHDSTEGVEEALEAAKGTPLEVIPGVEISAEKAAQEVHLLGYYIDHRYEPFQRWLRRVREFRRDRAWRILGKLSRLGVPLSQERVMEIAGRGSIGRPHIAQAMVERGYVSSTNEAFTYYLGRNGPAYVPRYKITPLQALQMILETRGLPVLAHPLEALHLLPELVDAGLVGLEVYYGQYNPQEVHYLAQEAARYNLLATGGSDFHGPMVLDTPPLGEVEVPEEALQRLRALAREQGPV